MPPLPFDLPQAAGLLAAAGLHDCDGEGTLDRAGKPFGAYAIGWAGHVGPSRLAVTIPAPG